MKNCPAEASNWLGGENPRVNPEVWFSLSLCLSFVSRVAWFVAVVILNSPVPPFSGGVLVAIFALQPLNRQRGERLMKHTNA